MTKVVLLDGDGVVIKKRGGYFSDAYCRERGVATEEMQVFFKNEFKLCQVGKADLKVELAKYLPKWKWQGTPEEFMQYWFENDADFDPEVLRIVKDLKARGVRVYLNTDQEQYRKKYLLERLKGIIDEGFFSCDLGVPKDDPQFFTQVIERLGVEPGEIIYFDDDQHSVDSARSVGIVASLYTSVEDLKHL